MLSRNMSGAICFIMAFTVMALFDAEAAELTGRQIMDTVSDYHEKQYELEVQKMTLIDKKGNKEERKVKRYSRKTDDGSRFLLVFHSPRGIKGSALLTWQYDKKSDDQWLYLPSMGRKIKRVAEGGKKNYFMGTDYTFEDMVSESRDNFNYKREPDEDFNGKAHFVVEATPATASVKKESGYGSRKMWIRKDIFFITRIDYFNKRGRLIKRQTSENLKNVGGKAWRAETSSMKNIKAKHTTKIEVTGRKFTADAVAKKVFKSRFITSGRHVR